MAAFDEIIKKNGSENLISYRKTLVSSNGSLISGSIPEYMDLTTRSKNKAIFDILSEKEIDETTSPERLGALFIKKPGKATHDYGFVFDKDGTEKIIRELIAGNQLQISKELSSYFYFEDDQKTELWHAAKDVTKRRLVAYDLMQLKKKTDIQYRIHGSRLHYLTLGKVTATIHEQSKSQRMSFPLFLFDCVRTDHLKQTAEIEQSGFVNFSLDEKYFNSEIQKITGGVTIDADETLPTRLISIKSKIEKLEIPNVEDIQVDITFSMISIVTGFEAEYLDKAWEKILA
ncbi:hypothetical protein IJG78_00145 [Candidatus Saccharibacteria bacterium]|nr:hypothetical protein [Candidatus Saccharibacteria bacterium]